MAHLEEDVGGDFEGGVGEEEDSQSEEVFSVGQVETLDQSVEFGISDWADDQKLALEK